MAAPTSVRVEAQSMTSALLRWTYGGASGISVYRSTDGISYSVVTADIPFSTFTYTDTTLSAETKYWYKLSDDLGSTFSSIVTVWTQTCLAPGGSADTFALPRFDGDTQQSDDLNNLAERVEEALGGRVLSPTQCVACPEDGAVVIDCSNGCNDWVVIADEDINSISVQWCESQPGNIEFIIPPNTSGRQICGWPAGFGFSGDECSKAPITSGPFGTSIGVGIGGAGGAGGSTGNPTSRRGYSPGSASGGGSGGTGCTCVPSATGGLTIKSCNANNSMKCTTTKSLKLLVCGGRGPYTWSRTGSVNLKGANQATAGSTATGTAVTVTPPTNPTPGTAGTAYTRRIESVDCGHTVGTTHACGSTWALFTCADAFDSCSTTLGGTVSGTFAFADSSCSCGTHSGHALSGCSSATVVSCDTICASGTECACATANGAMEDRRSAGMISAGCVPCGINAGATVSVTDAAGVTTTVILTG